MYDAFQLVYRCFACWLLCFWCAVYEWPKPDVSIYIGVPKITGLCHQNPWSHLFFRTEMTDILHTAFGDCPPSSQHTRCENKCLQNHECASMGGKCCPNLCNFSSCVIPKAGNSGVSGYKGCEYWMRQLKDTWLEIRVLMDMHISLSLSRISAATNSAYCGNVKCSPFEKCGTDSNKRPKCVRA